MLVANHRRVFFRVTRKSLKKYSSKYFFKEFFEVFLLTIFLLRIRKIPSCNRVNDVIFSSLRSTYFLVLLIRGSVCHLNDDADFSAPRRVLLILVQNVGVYFDRAVFANIFVLYIILLVLNSRFYINRCMLCASNAQKFKILISGHKFAYRVG